MSSASSPHRRAFMRSTRTCDVRVDRINARRWGEEADDIQVGCREAQFVPQAFALDHKAAQRVEATQHPSGQGKVAGANRVTNARAADGLAVQFHVAQSVEGEIEFAAQLAQQSDAAGAAGAEHETIPNADAFDLLEVAHQAADKLLAGDLAESFVKPNHIRGLHAERGDELQLFFQQIN